jgi:hypothetical protein
MKARISILVILLIAGLLYVSIAIGHASKAHLTNGKAGRINFHFDTPDRYQTGPIAANKIDRFECNDPSDEISGTNPPAARKPLTTQASALNLSHDLVSLGIAATNMVPNQQSLDAGPLFVQGVQYANSHGIGLVVADPGAYYFLSEQQQFISVPINQLSNLTIDFQGADLYFATVNAGFFFTACSNLIVENFTIDRLQPGYTQLKVTSVDPTLRQINFTVQPGWQNPTALNSLLNNPSVVFASPAQTDVFIFRNGRLWENYTPMPVQQPFNDDHLVIGSSKFITSALPTIRPGDIAVLRVRVGSNAIVADCTACTFRNIRVYSGMEGVDLMGPSSSSVLERVYVMPKPGTDRLVSTLADGTTLDQPGPNNTVRLCRSIRTLDDGFSPHIWVWGDVQSVTAARTAVIAGLGPTALAQRRPLPVASNVTFQRASDGLIFGNAVVTAESSITTVNGVNQVAVDFDRDLPSDVAGAYIYATDPSWRGDGLRLERNTVQEQGYATGISLWGLRNATVTGSYLRRTAMTGMSIINTLSNLNWLVPPVEGLTVTNNVIDGAPTELDNGAPLELAAIQATGVSAPTTFFTTSPNQNLTFTGNFIGNASRSGFYIGNTTGANLTNNYLLNPNNNPRQDRTLTRNIPDVVKPIAIEDSINVSTTNNPVDTTSGQVKVTDTQYRELAAYAPGGTIRLNAYNLGGLATPTSTLTDADGVNRPITIQSTSSHALDVQIPAGAALGGAYVTLTSGGSKYFGTLFIDSQENIPAVNGCTYEPSASSTSVPNSGGSVPILVVTQAGCSYAVADSDPFVTTGGNGTGTSVASVTFGPNSGAARNSTVEIAGIPITLTQAAAANVVQFSAANYDVQEDCTTVTITVNRLGDTSVAASVDYNTSDVTATERKDYISALGRLQFAPGETSKSFVVLINEDSLVEGNETFNVNLSNPAGVILGSPTVATVTIIDDPSEPGTNAIDDPRTFVCQHYHDFLNRQPDQSGWDFWTNEIASCGANQQCIEVKRINVSGAYFLSIEFQQTGYLVERIYKAAYGDAQQTSTFGGSHSIAVPTVRLSEFLPDVQQIGNGVIVNQGNWQQQLENNKVAFSQAFVQRSRFTTAFATGMSPTNFVTQLANNAGVSPNDPDRAKAIGEFGAATNTSDVAARGRALRDLAENATLFNAEQNRAFVLMQYFGYLRRDPNTAPDTDYTGYDFWLTKLNQFNGDYLAAEMVKAFISSTEYRQRFGP